jgi:uncharacterized protein
VNLLDVNTLIALAWDDHEHHQAAHEWFSANAQAGFATCHVTQSGFLRISLNPIAVHCKIAASEATAMLASLTSQPNHTFWEDGPVQTNSTLWLLVTGRNEVTDTNLFLIARRNSGKLVTFDGTLKNRLPHPQRQWVDVIEG